MSDLNPIRSSGRVITWSIEKVVRGYDGAKDFTGSLRTRISDFKASSSSVESGTKTPPSRDEVEKAAGLGKAQLNPSNPYLLLNSKQRADAFLLPKQNQLMIFRAEIESWDPMKSAEKDAIASHVATGYFIDDFQGHPPPFARIEQEFPLSVEFSQFDREARASIFHDGFFSLDKKEMVLREIQSWSVPKEKQSIMWLYLFTHPKATVHFFDADGNPMKARLFEEPSRLDLPTKPEIRKERFMAGGDFIRLAILRGEATAWQVPASQLNGVVNQLMKNPHLPLNFTSADGRLMGAQAFQGAQEIDTSSLTIPSEDLTKLTPEQRKQAFEATLDPTQQKAILLAEIRSWSVLPEHEETLLTTLLKNPTLPIVYQIQVEQRLVRMRGTAFSTDDHRVVGPSVRTREAAKDIETKLLRLNDAFDSER